MYILSPLPYATSDLEPVIDTETMHLHHEKHHQGYVDKLNAALDGVDVGSKSVEELIANLDAIPEEKRTAVQNAGGGHANHVLFWSVMCKEGSAVPEELETAIKLTFGSVEKMKEEFTKVATAQFGSGWAWLIVASGKLHIASTGNQDSPLMGEKYAGISGIPILTIDVWEHAYYLNYQNRRPEYVEQWWSVVNWEEVGRRFKDVMIG